jgi:hypothetical protein
MSLPSKYGVIMTMSATLVSVVVLESIGYQDRICRTYSRHMGNPYRILAGRSTLWRPRHGRDDNIKMNGEMICEVMNWNPLIQARIQWWFIINLVRLMKLWVS